MPLSDKGLTSHLTRNQATLSSARRQASKPASTLGIPQRDRKLPQLAPVTTEWLTNAFQVQPPRLQKPRILVLNPTRISRCAV